MHMVRMINVAPHRGHIVHHYQERMGVFRAALGEVGPEGHGMDLGDIAQHAEKGRAGCIDLVGRGGGGPAEENDVVDHFGVVSRES